LLLDFQKNIRFVGFQALVVCSSGTSDIRWRLARSFCGIILKG